MANANNLHSILVLLLLLSLSAAAQELIFNDGFENRAPVIISSPVTTPGLDLLYSYDVEATDPDGDTLVYLLTTSPDGMTVNPGTGMISWIPPGTGEYPVEIDVSDGNRGFAIQAWTITVTEVLDTDEDGLSDGEEVYVYGTDPLKPDTDGDGVNDGDEVKAGTDPLDKNDGGLPPDPSEVAPELDLTVGTLVPVATEFLYDGPDPIQTGVAPGTIEPLRAAVLRGLVTDRNGSPVPGVTITVLDHPEYGQTLTRTDGVFDLAVNGGGLLTVNYRHGNYLTVQRQIEAVWQDYIWLPNVVLTSLDSAVTTVDLTNTEPMQVVVGSPVTDADGTRQAVLMIPQGTAADLIMPDGSTQPISTLNIRATEYTVGENGPEAMPAALPASSGYTYAVELSADEAITAGASDVVFDQPVAFYLENFIGFPVGSIVPAGYYDKTEGEWIASDNGLVIEVVGISAGLADVDVDGDTIADTGTKLTDLGITDTERETLALQYSVGETLWRVPITHFTPWDCNWPYGPPGDAVAPPGPGPGPGSGSGPGSGGGGKDCPASGFSTIYCQSQTLGERIDLTGTPYSLNYHSGRVLGFVDGVYEVEIPISEASVPISLVGIQLEVSIAGQVVKQMFPADPNLSYEFVWDGKDGYGRLVQGQQRLLVKVGYVYGAIPLEPAGQGQAFAQASGSGRGVDVSADRSSSRIVIWRVWDEMLGPWDARAQSLAGWTLNIHHAYDVLGRTLYLGDGGRRDATGVSGTIETVALLNSAQGITFDSDGSFYVSEFSPGVISKVDAEDTVSTVIGTTVGYSGDGGPANAAQLNGPRGMDIGPDGSLYIADNKNHRIRRVDTNGIITTIAGTGGTSYNGDDIPAVDASLYYPWDVAAGPDGSVYISDWSHARIRRVSPSGTISTVAGTGNQCCYNDSFEGEPATTAAVNFPTNVDVADDGTVYFIMQFRVMKINPDGTINTVAGGGSDPDVDGSLATDVSLSQPQGLAIGSDGNIEFGQGTKLRRVDANGILTTIAGTGVSGFSGDGGFARAAQMRGTTGIDRSPKGALYFVDSSNRRVRRIGVALPGFSATDINVPSEDGNQLFVFTSQGRHLSTLSTLTSASLFDFDYDSEGRLSQVVDGDGNTTPIERDVDGSPQAIVAPGGQRTTLQVNADGYLSEVSNPANEAHTLGYGSDGLLTSFTNPRDDTSSMTYSTVGRLIRDEDAEGGFQALDRVENDNGYTVTKTSAQGRTTVYQMEFLESGEFRSTVSGPDGDQTVVVAGTDGTNTITEPNGRMIEQIYGPDPRFGILSPVLTDMAITSPNGLVANIIQSRIVTLTDPLNPLALQSLQDTTIVNGRTFQNNYDGPSRTLTKASPGGHVIISVLDELGRVVDTTLAPGMDPITVTYDAQGRLTRSAHGGQHWDFGYDAGNRIVSRTDALGNEVQYSYDSADRLVQLIKPGSGTVTYDYDANGNRTSLTMPGGQAHAMSYTQRNERSAYIPPDSTGFSRSYSLDKFLLSRTLPSGRSLVNDYDVNQRWMGLDYPEAAVDYTYSDPTDRLSSLLRTPAVGSSQEIAYLYDGDLVTEAAWSGAADGSFQYSYDNNFLFTNITLASGSDNVSSDVVWNSDGLPIGYGPFSITRGGPGGAPSQISDGTLVREFSYDTLARVQSRSQTVSSNAVYNFVLTRNALGQITQKVESVNGSASTYAYVYDADNRLISVTKDAATVEQYNYDANGNRTGTLAGAANYDSQDRITTHEGVNYNLDADGYLTQRGSDSFEYSTRGELLTVTLGGTTEISYGYDGHGRRVSRTDSSGTTQFLYGHPWDMFLVTSIRDVSGVLTSLYHDESGLLFAFERGGGRYYVATDQVGTPKVVTDNTGAVVKVLSFDSFGRRLSDSNPSFELPIGFAGGLEDPDTGLVRFGYRDFDQASGRWMARDPVLYEGGQANLYLYVGNNPVSQRDPMGLWCAGVSVYAVFGGGGELCCSNGNCSICSEGGVGEGVDAGIGGGDPKDDGTGFFAEMGASCGPVGAGLKCEANSKCGGSCVAEGVLGPYKVDTSGGAGASEGFGDPLDSDSQNSKTKGGKCSIQGKAGVRGCGSW